mmetsp:Transcript_39693/g.63513  ORF Transcript_39693/g.63513 Transcript_39693/m.63513 type:complete len:166 (-) Transcript_39693:307-804(-)
MNYEQAFMLFWSLASGFGIIFAIESWLYDMHGLKQDPYFPGFKGVVAVCLGFLIGGIHYALSTKCTQRETKDDIISETAKPAARTEIVELPPLRKTEEPEYHRVSTHDTGESELQSINRNTFCENPFEQDSNPSPENSAYKSDSNIIINVAEIAAVPHTPEIMYH